MSNRVLKNSALRQISLQHNVPEPCVSKYILCIRSGKRMAKGCKASGNYLAMKEHLFEKTVLHLDILLPCSSSWVVVVVVF